MVFRKRRRNEEPIEITLSNKIIPSKESTQFLGKTLNCRLNLKEHIDRVRAKEKKPLNTIKVVADKKWGEDYRTLKRLYSVVFRSKIDYGC